MNMILAVDIGNTNITIGLYNDDALIFVSRLGSDKSKMPDQYASELSGIFRLYSIKSENFGGAIIGSVVPELTSVIKSAVMVVTGRTPLVLGPGVKTGLNIVTDNPAQLGSDLVAGAIGAILKYETPCLVLDLGTATKISAIDSQGRYRGCAIAPGVKISLNALSSGTAQLPSVSIEAPASSIGTNTITSMQSGLVLGTASMIDGMCVRMEKDLGEEVKTIVATGGVSSDIIKCCNINPVSDPNLVLDGLKAIYDKNKRTRSQL